MRKGKRTFASRKRKIAGLCALVLAGVIGVGVYAFTASNTVAETGAGYGAGVVSGYEISAPETIIGAEAELTEAKFTITKTQTEEPEAKEAKIAFTEPGKAPTAAQWSEACTVTAGPPAAAKCKWATDPTDEEVKKDTEAHIIATS